MAFADLLAAVTSSALDGLTDFDRSAALDAGVKPAQVREWAVVHEAYFGPTTAPKKQRAAVALARAGGFSLDQLVLIEQRVGAVADRSERMRLRLALLATRGTYDALKRRASELIPAQAPKPPKKQVSFGRSRQGTRSMKVTADERDIADIEHFLSAGVDPAQPAAPQMLAPFLNLVRGGCGAAGAGDTAGADHAAGPRGVPRAVPRPLLLIPLPEWTKIVGQRGNETILGLSDGTTMTGAEFLAEHFGAELEVALFHPQHGAVNLYRTQRFANQKQRDLARATMPICPVPGCRHGADACEIHHVKAWKHGGETNVGNLAPVCRYHNRTNDDDPHITRRGRIEMTRGAPVWVSPRGYQARNAHAEYGAMHALFSAADA